MFNITCKRDECRKYEQFDKTLKQFTGGWFKKVDVAQIRINEEDDIGESLEKYVGYWVNDRRKWGNRFIQMYPICL